MYVKRYVAGYSGDGGLIVGGGLHRAFRVPGSLRWDGGVENAFVLVLSLQRTGTNNLQRSLNVFSIFSIVSLTTPDKSLSVETIKRGDQRMCC